MVIGVTSCLVRKEEEKKDLWELWNDYGDDLPGRANKHKLRSKQPNGAHQQV
jgi:hypothetical protein